MIFIEGIISLLFLVAALLELNYNSLRGTLFERLTVQFYVEDLAQWDWAIACVYLLIFTIFWFLIYYRSKWRAKLYLEYLTRIGVGALFIAASIFKIKDPELFSMLVAQYQFLPSFAVNLFSLLLPVLELIGGILLIVGPKTRWNAKIILFMLTLFIIALSQALIRDLGITCGCFDIEGAQDKKGAWVALIRDLLLVPPMLFLSLRTRQCWIWDPFTLNGSPRSGYVSKRRF